MAETENKLATADTEAIRYLEEAIARGQHWYIALLGAMGLWRSAEEVHEGRTYHYLIAGEAFDWLLLAERLCEAVDGLLPEKEKDTLLFSGKPPLSLNVEKVKELIGSAKYLHYLNYFYGVTVEQALLLAVQEEVQKEKHPFCDADVSEEEAYQRVYGAAKTDLLKQFRRDKGYPLLRTTSLDELKQFTYWLVKYRLKENEKARVASDTKKGLDYLKQRWGGRGITGGPITD